ncbi:MULTISPECIES: 3-hydroxybutyrate dehydrogenase [Comamonas]|jgi:3-hydroxybutyrate dehydrogenase|uniref:3-hydroxybutyrate dehydrogenase n=1 Tax=Comamonas TaxID=283 RepID=UPI0012C3113C|nr:MULTISPECIES: 3-hydroxybutyrate dehydrogenase [Comamonas]MDR3065964.1 3-hydroxybutyrate dehydrogenase [Comamonas sp.]MEB5963842.1 3-hydroxybutyrate dehydrogenase [Comamonas testosteroni]MPS95891.1 SDR family NAD(P)-dependent oxidoreductase [Comamonas sp.]
MTAAPLCKPHAGRVAWITGSTSGIGWAVARQLAAEGAAIAMHGSAEASAATDARLAELQALGVAARYYPLDLRDAQAIAPLARRIAAELGTVDILVNNAGIQHVESVLSFPQSQWDALMAVNLSAPFHSIQACTPAMLERGWGRIINMASVSGLVGVAHKPAYVASKHGLLGLTKSVALELATTPVTCNAICPGWVLTPLVQAQIEALAQREQLEEAAARARLLGAKQPSQAFVTAEQVAAMVGFLAGDNAAQVRGAQWTMDGGFTAA